MLQAEIWYEEEEREDDRALLSTIFVPIQWLWQNPNRESWLQQALQKQAGYLELSVPWPNLEVDRILWIERKLNKN
jgi:hypothetical protein